MRKSFLLLECLFFSLFLSSCSWLKLFKHDDGVLRVAVFSLPQSFDPAVATTGQQYDYLSLFYESLIDVKQEEGLISVVPRLLKKLPEVTDNGKVFRFTLDTRDFAGGSPHVPERAVNSEDVLWSILRVAKLNHSLKYQNDLSKIKGLRSWLGLPVEKQQKTLPEGMKIHSAHEFSIALTEATPQWYLIFTQIAFAITPKEVFAAPELLQYGPLGTLNNKVEMSSATSLVIRQKSQRIVEFHKVNYEDAKKKFEQGSYDVLELPPTENTLSENIQVVHSLPVEMSFLKVSSAVAFDHLEKHVSVPLLMRKMNMAGMTEARYLPWARPVEKVAEASQTAPKEAVLIMPEGNESELFAATLTSMIETADFKIRTEYFDPFSATVRKKTGTLEIEPVFYLYDSLDSVNYVDWISLTLGLTSKQKRELLQMAQGLPSQKAADLLSEKIHSLHRLISLGGFARRFAVREWVQGVSFELNRVVFNDVYLDTAERKMNK